MIILTRRVVTNNHYKYRIKNVTCKHDTSGNEETGQKKVYLTGRLTAQYSEIHNV